MTSTNVKIQKLAGLLGTKDVNSWEQEFLESIVERSNSGKQPSNLSDRQIEVMERIYDKHFG